MAGSHASHLSRRASHLWGSPRERAQIPRGHEGCEVVCPVVMSQRLGQAHIRQLRAVAFGQQYVGRLEVKVHNVCSMQEGQPARHVQCDAPAQLMPGVFHGCPPNGCAQVPPLHVLCHQNCTLSALHHGTHSALAYPLELCCEPSETGTGLLSEGQQMLAVQFTHCSQSVHLQVWATTPLIPNLLGNVSTPTVRCRGEVVHQEPPNKVSTKGGGGGSPSSNRLP